MDSHGARDGEIEKGIATVQAITWEVGQCEFIRTANFFCMKRGMNDCVFAGKQGRALDFFFKRRDGSCGGGVCHECIASHEDVAQIRCHQRRRES